MTVINLRATPIVVVVSGLRCSIISRRISYKFEGAAKLTSKPRPVKGPSTLCAAHKFHKREGIIKKLREIKSTACPSCADLFGSQHDVYAT